MAQTEAPSAANVTEHSRPSPVGLDQESLIAGLKRCGVPDRQMAMRLGQIRHSLYVQGVQSFADMTTLPVALRHDLEQIWQPARPEVVAEDVSGDGTSKWLLRYRDGQEVETVHIPEVDRGTLCISSQIGCSLSCTFCHTGTMPLVRNLTAGEILDQVLLARDRLGEWRSGNGERRVSHIVVMGMGEPLLNYDNIAAALKILMDSKGLEISRRRITLSTSGVVPRIEQCGRDLGINLAISLHAVRDELRDQLVPINRKWNIAAVLDACRAYPVADRWVTFEYVMLQDVNDSDADARELVRLIRGIPAKVNLIPFNPWPGSSYTCSTKSRIEAFAEIVMRAGYPSPVRTPRGRDILAACGQLKTASQRRFRNRSPKAA